MKNNIFLPFFVAFLLISSPAWTQQTKIIKLKDGSTITGTVTSMQNGIYTIHSNDLGILDIEEERVLSISIPRNTPLPMQNVTAGNQNKMLEIKSQMMANPTLMNDVQELLKDPNIVSLLSDKELINAVLQFDQESVQQNENFQKLIQYPAMKKLIDSNTQLMLQSNQ